MNRRPLQPLDAEERALADQLGRLGPHGEPSAKLDARILAAAHDAVAAQPAAVRRRPRWPMGFGVAASVMLAVAVAWQLRPMQDGPEALEEAAHVPATAQADAAAPAAAPMGPPVVRFESRPPPPPPPAMARVENPPARDTAASTPATASRKPAPIVQHRVATAPAERAARAQRPANAAASVAVDEDTPAALPLRASEAASLDRFDVDYAAVPAPPAPAPAAPAAAREEPRVFGYVADAETTAAVALRREQARAAHARYATEAAEAAEKAESRNRAIQASADLQDTLPSSAASEFGRSLGGVAPIATGKRAPTQSAALPAGATRNALKRTDLQLPVAEDTKLESDAWLERIRLRRDLGDRASATDSLLRFKQQHPFQKVPEDLKELLGE